MRLPLTPPINTSIDQTTDTPMTWHAPWCRCVFHKMLPRRWGRLAGDHLPASGTTGTWGQYSADSLGWRSWILEQGATNSVVITLIHSAKSHSKSKIIFWLKSTPFHRDRMLSGNSCTFSNIYIYIYIYIYIQCVWFEVYLTVYYYFEHVFISVLHYGFNYYYYIINDNTYITFFQMAYILIKSIT